MAELTSHRQRVGLLLCAAALLVGCAAPATAKPSQVPASVLTSLSAEERGDLKELLDGFALDEASEDWRSYELRYRSWLANPAAADAIAWEIVQIQPRAEGGQVVVTRIFVTCYGQAEVLSQEVSTDESGKIVGWTIAREPSGSAASPPSHRGNGKTDPPECG